MYHFRTNPPCRQVKPAPAYIPTFYPVPSVGDAIAPAKVFAGESVKISPLPHNEAEVIATNAELLDGLTCYLATRPALDEAMLGRLFAKDSELLPDMRQGRVLPVRLVERIAAFVAREVPRA